MKWGKSLVAVLLFFSLTAPTARADDKRQVVAVFKINVQRIDLTEDQIDMLTDLMSEELGLGGVFQVMPPGDIKQALLEQTKDSYKKCYDEKCQIEIGRQLSANKVLTTTVRRISSECRVTSSLYDLKQQATDIIVKEKVGCNESDLVKAVEKLAAKIRAFRAGDKALSDFDNKMLGEEVTDWNLKGKNLTIARFESKPAGAAVLVDNKLVCRRTPCSKSVPVGTHRLSMQVEKYQERIDQVVISDGASFSWELTPNFGWLNVRSNPAALTVKLNGEPFGRTPVERKEISAGAFEVLVSSPCHYDAGERVVVGKNEEKSVQITLKEKQGAVDVKASDSQGNDVAAQVFVDGAQVGMTPGTFKVSICAKTVEIRHAEHGSATRKIYVKERAVETIAVTLTEKEVRTAFEKAESSTGNTNQMIAIWNEFLKKHSENEKYAPKARERIASLLSRLEIEKGEIRQEDTALYWLRCPVGMKWDGEKCAGEATWVKWKDAANICPAGYRLPTVEEFVYLLEGCWVETYDHNYSIEKDNDSLEDAMDDGRTITCRKCRNSSTCLSVFQKKVTEYNDTSFWTPDGDEKKAWLANFTDGYIGTTIEPNKRKNMVVCVRSEEIKPTRGACACKHDRGSNRLYAPVLIFIGLIVFRRRNLADGMK
jgi:uncharacterized protein (TIGR02145 family)